MPKIRINRELIKTLVIVSLLAGAVGFWQGWNTHEHYDLKAVHGQVVAPKR